MGLIIIYLSVPKRDSNPSTPNVQEIVRDSIIRDSIYIVNDSIVEKIKYIDKEYDEKVSTIMSSSDSINLCFFSEYIDRYNNQRTVKDNLIFAEHQKLSETVPLLKSQITNLELINKSWEKTDSVRRVQLLYYGNIIEDKNRSIEGLNKSLKKKQNVIKYGAAGSCVLILLCLLLK